MTWMREGADHDVDTLPGKITLKRIWVTELTGVASRSAWRATLNTNTSTKLEAIEPRTIATISIFSSVEFQRP
jgi:hypothetical protein